MDRCAVGVFTKFISYVLLMLMIINPAMALQHNKTIDYVKKITEFNPKVHYVHVSNEKAYISNLRNQGFDVIEASIDDVKYLFDGKLTFEPDTIQLAATPEYKSTKENDDCSSDDKKCKSGGGQVTGDVIKGGGNDTAKVMLIAVGLFVVAALFIYTGKYVVDMIRGEGNYKYWLSVGMQYMFLDTPTQETGKNIPEEHGEFVGVKISAGFVDESKTQIGVIGEFGYMDIDLLVNKNQETRRLDLTGSYWLMGAVIKYNFGTYSNDKTKQNEYLFLELMAGTTEHSETKNLAVARLGFLFNMYKKAYWGFHIGALYLGLDEDQGFNNDRNYWLTVGAEIGYNF